MPRHIIRATERIARHPRLVRALAREIKEPSGDPQPLILEEEIQPNGSRHVQVIWELWKKVPQEDREQVILEAYAQAEGEAYAESIAIAAGYAPLEALALGLLPWVVMPVNQLSSIGPAPTSGLSDVSLEAAIQEEAKNTVLGPKLTTKHGLRYAFKEDAIAACRRLQAHVRPSPVQWRVREDLPEDNDAR